MGVDLVEGNSIRPRKPFVVASAGLGVVALASAGLAVWGGATNSASANGLAGAVGLLITAAALVVALLIYDLQTQRSDASDTRLIETRDGVHETRELVKGLPGLMAGAAAAHGESSNTQVDEPKPEVDDEEKARQVPRDALLELGVAPQLIDEFEAYEGGSIPLTRLTSLYDYVSEREVVVEGGLARLTPSDVYGFRPKRSGRIYWYIATPIPPGPGRSPESRRAFQLWRVTASGGVEAVGRVDANGDFEIA